MKILNSLKLSKKKRECLKNGKILAKGLTLFTLTSFLVLFQNCADVKLNRPVTAQQTASAAVHIIKPVLAVRGAACVMCHAQISNSNIVTDFGYGDPFFMGRNTGGGNSVYRDSGAGGWTSYPRPAITGTVFMPDVSVTSNIIPNQKLLSYWTGLLGVNPFNISGGFKTRKSIYIGAPTEDQIRLAAVQPSAQIIGASSGGVSIYRANGGATLLGGLLIKQNDVNGSYYVRNNDILRCSGDIIIDGSLFLKDLVYETAGGCRIYTTGSIFIQGSPRATAQSISPNLQLSSAHAVVIGMRSLTQRFNNAEFETGLRGAKTSIDEQLFNQKVYSDRDSIDDDLTDDAGPFKLEWFTTKDFSGNIKTYAGMYETDDDNGQFTAIPGAIQPNPMPTCSQDARGAGTPPDQLDGTSPNGSSACVMMWAGAYNRKSPVFEHIAVNAPIVFNRYAGEFHGLVIAEKALFAVGQLNFVYDSGFDTVDIFPLFGAQIFSMSDN